MKWKTVLLDLLFPPKCVFCRVLLNSSEELICPDCQQRLPWLVGNEAHRKLPMISDCVSPLSFQGNVRESIHRYKFNGKSWYAQNYGILMAQCVQDHLEGSYDLISWVPVSRQRKRERGYDQSFLLAYEMGKVFGQRPAALLKKIKNTQPQSGRKSESARRSNVKGAYIAIRKEMLAGKRILLVDDIVTTGETLLECTRTLKAAGAGDIVCVTLASTSGEPL